MTHNATRLRVKENLPPCTHRVKNARTWTIYEERREVMKAKGKKAEKNKVSLSKKEETPKAVQAVVAPIVPQTTAKSVIETASVVAPMKVLIEESVVTKPVDSVKVDERRTVSFEERRRLIALAAYYRAQRVGFGKTNPVEDWLLAEREVDAMITNGPSI